MQLCPTWLKWPQSAPVMGQFCSERDSWKWQQGAAPAEPSFPQGLHNRSCCWRHVSHWQMVSCCVGSPTINPLEYRTAEITLALSQICGEESYSLSGLDTLNRHFPLTRCTYRVCIHSLHRKHLHCCCKALWDAQLLKGALEERHQAVGFCKGFILCIRFSGIIYWIAIFNKK